MAWVMGAARAQPWWQRVSVTTSSAGHSQVEVRCGGFTFGDGAAADFCSWLEKSLHLANGPKAIWLDLRSTSLGDMGVDLLANSLSVLRLDVERLWLSSAALTPSCLASLQRLAATPSLQELHLDDNSIDDEAAYLLLNAVANARNPMARPAWVSLRGNVIHDPAAVLERLRQAGTSVQLQGGLLASTGKSSHPVAAKLVVPGFCDQPLAPGGPKDSGHLEQGTDDAQRLVEALGVLTEALSLGDDGPSEDEHEPGVEQASDKTADPAVVPEDGADWDPYLFCSPVYGEGDSGTDRVAPLSPRAPKLLSPQLQPRAPPTAPSLLTAAVGVPRSIVGRSGGALGGEVAGALAALRGLLSVHNTASTVAVDCAGAGAAPAPQVAVGETPEAPPEGPLEATRQDLQVPDRGQSPVSVCSSDEEGGLPPRRPTPEERLASLVAGNAWTGAPAHNDQVAGSGHLMPQMSTTHVLAPAAQLHPQSSLDTFGLSTVNPGMQGPQVSSMQPPGLPPIHDTLLSPAAYQPQVPLSGCALSMHVSLGDQQLSPPQGTGMRSIEVPVSAFQASLAEQARLQTAWPQVATLPPVALAASERPRDPRVASSQPQPAPAAPSQERLAQYEAALLGISPVANGKRSADGPTDTAAAPWASRRRRREGTQQ